MALPHTSSSFSTSHGITRPCSFFHWTYHVTSPWNGICHFHWSNVLKKSNEISKWTSANVYKHFCNVSYNVNWIFEQVFVRIPIHHINIRVWYVSEIQNVKFDERCMNLLLEIFETFVQWIWHMPFCLCRVKISNKSAPISYERLWNNPHWRWGRFYWRLRSGGEP